MSFCLSVFSYFCLFIFLSFHILVLSSFCLFIFLSFCLFAFLSFCLSAILGHLTSSYVIGGRLRLINHERSSSLLNVDGPMGLGGIGWDGYHSSQSASTPINYNNIKKGLHYQHKFQQKNFLRHPVPPFMSIAEVYIKFTQLHCTDNEIS